MNLEILDRELPYEGLSELDNLIHTNRWSGKLMIKSESVSDHVWCMISLALTFKLKYDLADNYPLRDIIYRIVIHDIGESFYCDIPRNFKYKTKELGKLINETEEILIKNALGEDMLKDVKGAKDINNKCGLLVQSLDLIQAGNKMYQEIQLGNEYFRKEILNSINALTKFLEIVEENCLRSFIRQHINKFMLMIN